MPGKFELKQAKNGKYFFNLKSGNGEIVLTSQMYADRGGCENGIASVKTNATSESQFDVMEDNAGKPYFVLKAKNSQVIGRSQSYASKSSLKKGIASVMRNAPEARIVEVQAQS